MSVQGTGGDADDVATKAAAGEAEEEPKVEPIWAVMAGIVCVEFALGIAALLAVPYGRATAWVPAKGRAVYLPHAVLGALLGAGALYLLARYGSSPQRIRRLAAKAGIAGIVLGAAGGFLAVDHSLRLAGMALMLLGGLVAAIGYAMPSLEAHDRRERAALAARFEEEASGPPFA